MSPTACWRRCRPGRLGPLDPVYPIIYFDCLFVKSRQDGSIRNKAVYLALGINMDGEKELLGMWLGETEGAKFWLSVFNELKTRGVEDCFIACVDGLQGLPEAIETVYPHAQVQLCIVHQVRNSLKYVNWKDRKRVAADLRAIYTAPTEALARAALEQCAEKWAEQYPAIAPSWGRNWERPDAVLCLSAGDPQGGLHHQCYRVAELHPAENHQGARRLPARRRHQEVALSGVT